MLDYHLHLWPHGQRDTAPTLEQVADYCESARAEGVTNFSVFCNHVTIVPPIKAILESPDLRLDGFLGPGHVSTVVGNRPYRFVAEQYGRYGVRINTVNPGPVNTDRWDGLEKALARDKKIDQKHAHELALSSIPFHRICEPGEVASLVTFLVSPRASFINGAHIPIDGAQRKALMDI